MIRLIHRDTGDFFWVHESRLDEYLEKGHRLPPPPPPPPKPEPEPAVNENVSDPDTIPTAENVSDPDTGPAEKPRRKPGRPKNAK